MDLHLTGDRPTPEEKAAVDFELGGAPDSVWEGGVRVPAIMRWPGHIPSGKTSPQVGSVMDVTATALKGDVDIDTGSGLELAPTTRTAVTSTAVELISALATKHQSLTLLTL